MRPCSVYSMVDESSDEVKFFPTRKKSCHLRSTTSKQIFIFYFFPLTKNTNLCRDPSTIEYTGCKYTESGLTCIRSRTFSKHHTDSPFKRMGPHCVPTTDNALQSENIQFLTTEKKNIWNTESVNYCPIFIIYFLFCSYFQAASIYCKSQAENLLEEFGLNPLQLVVVGSN